ncbi:hypothetical protein MRB53_005978 [Persea americana]|uniref:Uncharacterized protein n=1 Tax=Persea americana TaxID=3435 RepID=A0ACC2MEX3_PERAE|nr:hypothetical protein MRB53_005978 [Persea americana]
MRLRGQVGVEVADLAKHIKDILEQVRIQIEKSNARYEVAADKHRHEGVFGESGLVWVYLRKERFPIGTYHKLRGAQDRALQSAQEDQQQCLSSRASR